jgi:hypothetical protein
MSLFLLQFADDHNESFYDVQDNLSSSVAGSFEPVLFAFVIKIIVITNTFV